VQFYTASFDWGSEVVSIRHGHRRHQVTGMTPAKAPMNIVDPFDSTRNLGMFMTADAQSRLQGELCRATELCDRGGSLTELLELWTPGVNQDGDEP